MLLESLFLWQPNELKSDNNNSIIFKPAYAIYLTKSKLSENKENRNLEYTYLEDFHIP